MSSYQYPSPGPNWPRRQNFIPDLGLPTPDKLEYQSNPNYPCEPETMQSIHLAIELRKSFLCFTGRSFNIFDATMRSIRL